MAQNLTRADAATGVSIVVGIARQHGDVLPHPVMMLAPVQIGCCRAARCIAYAELYIGTVLAFAV